MNQIVSMKWLLARLYEPDLIIVDCRFQLSDPSMGRNNYTQRYIPGAVYFDLEKDLSGTVKEHGGRHPLPDMEQFVGKSGQVGIDPSVRVVAYDDQGGAMASRLWWLLRYIGHSQVFVMDEGFSAWEKAGYPVTSDTPPTRVPRKFVPQLRSNMLVDMNTVRGAMQDDSIQLIDSRAENRYLGLEEPIDPVAGHIPNADNYFWKDNMTSEGAWNNKETLQARFHAIPKDKNIIVYCGSGVTACPNIIALTEAGYEKVQLYGGSWSDWISYPDNPIETKK